MACRLASLSYYSWYGGQGCGCIGVGNGDGDTEVDPKAEVDLKAEIQTAFDNICWSTSKVLPKYEVDAFKVQILEKFPGWNCHKGDNDYRKRWYIDKDGEEQCQMVTINCTPNKGGRTRNNQVAKFNDKERERLENSLPTHWYAGKYRYIPVPVHKKKKGGGHSRSF
eukprot:SAG22_NODE_2655_length_2333_cov_5.679499_2_plen_167_part_00